MQSHLGKTLPAEDICGEGFALQCFAFSQAVCWCNLAIGIGIYIGHHLLHIISCEFDINTVQCSGESILMACGFKVYGLGMALYSLFQSLHGNNL